MDFDPQVDTFFLEELKWPVEMKAMRKLCHQAGLKEVLKWGQHCYTAGGRNVVVLQQFKDHCSFGFFQGVLMQDPSGLLVQLTENSQSARKVVFHSAEDIASLEVDLMALLKEGARVAESGEKVKFKETEAFDMPEELEQAMASDAAFGKAFSKLSPGRQRGYILYVGGAKQASTRLSRIERHRERILLGKGLQDR